MKEDKEFSVEDRSVLDWKKTFNETAGKVGKREEYIYRIVSLTTSFAKETEDDSIIQEYIGRLVGMLNGADVKLLKAYREKGEYNFIIEK